jgi:hypothetical protein
MMRWTRTEDLAFLKSNVKGSGFSGCLDEWDLEC